MVQINFSLKEVNCKIVYYGPGLSGKTTNLEIVHQKAPGQSVGELTSIATEGDRTLFFDFLPLNLGQVAGMKTKFQIYTVPGQVYYNSTRKLVLQGTDGIVFVADSKRGKMDENLESLNNLVENLKEYGMDINSMPCVLQYNKRDLPDVYTVEEMDAAMNKWGFPTFEAVAREGTGVFPTLKHLAGMVLESLNRQHGGGSGSGGAASLSAPAPAAAPAAGGGGTAVATAPPAVRTQAAPAAVAPRAAAAPAEAAVRRAPEVAARVAAAPSAGAARASGGKGKFVAIGAILLVAAVAAALHFTGVLQGFLQ